MIPITVQRGFICYCLSLKPAQAAARQRPNTTLESAAMATFFTSELFRNFLGGFVLGTVLVFTFTSGEEPASRDGDRPSAVATLES